MGRRVAFDPHKGRLWVVCGGCRAWNLAPLEERWEAVEEAERLFGGATIGSSTDNVALGRLPEGLEMVRVGRVKRPELAFWRYSDRLLSRWRKHRRGMWIYVGGGAMIASAFGSVLWMSVVAGTAAIQLRQGRRPFMRTESNDLVRLTHGRSARIERSDAGDGWRLSIPRFRSEPLNLHGAEALRALRGLLPYLNPAGGDPQQIRNASQEVERLGSPDAVLREAAVELRDMRNTKPGYRLLRAPGRIITGNSVIQLAIEMAANEETESRALSGEMALLEKEWRDAEEIASIADDLLIPGPIRSRLISWNTDRPQ